MTQAGQLVDQGNGPGGELNAVSDETHHSEMRVRPQRYIQLAGVLFRDEAERAEQRIFGDVWVRETGTDSPE
jgi:hypothetical protein